MSSSEEKIDLSNGLESVNISSTTSDTSDGKKELSNDNSDQNIRVFTRIRPLSTKEKNEESKDSIKACEVSKSITIENNRNFEFDGVLGPNSTQKEVYDKTAGKLIHNIFKGFNVTVLAYGQTGSGKTHTMSGGDAKCHQNDGIIPRIINEIFEELKKLDPTKKEFKVELSYLEIYNEEARDLLCDNQSPLNIREHKDEGVVVQDLSLHNIKSPQQVAGIIESASKRRATASTAMNSVSSRSHSICTLHVTISPSINLDEGSHEIAEETKAKLTLVDLAGSERMKRTGAEGARMKEGININRGLFVLGQVVSALCEAGQQQSSNTGGTNNKHIKYRDSKLTRLLQDSLGGNSKTIMIACVSPADSNVEESINTLRYAERTRSIKNTAVRNIVTAITPAEAAALRRENQMLKLQLFQAKAKLDSISSESTSSIPLIYTNHSHRTNNLSLDSRLDMKINEPHTITTSLSKTIESSTKEIIKAIDGPSNSKGNHEEENGLNIHEFDVMTKLHIKCSSMQTTIDQQIEKINVSVEDSLNASIRADKWQHRYEVVMAEMKSKGLDITEEDFKASDIIKQLRTEMSEVKVRLYDAQTDAAVSRTAAAAIFSVKGDVFKAESMILTTGETNIENSEDETSTELSEHLSKQLVITSGSIEQKEAMLLQMNKERECMDGMRSHFEGAVETLQQEVCALMLERENLLIKTNKGGAKISEQDPKVTKMRQRIDLLEKRIQELKRKTAEHSKSLRLREQAERKCAHLQTEIREDKKRRAGLQRKLKEQSEERRLEKKTAECNAKKLLRNSQKLKYELSKVKDTAARQAAVLRRKATESISKQKAAAEQKRKRNNASTMKASLISSKYESLTKERREELVGWLSREVNAAYALRDMKFQISQQEEQLEDTETKRMSIIAKKDNNLNSTIQSLDCEIELRSGIITQLETNIVEVLKAANSNTQVGHHKRPTVILDNVMWQGFSRSELRFISINLFEQVFDYKHDHDKLKLNHNDLICRSVSSAVAQEKHKAEQAIILLKIKNSETITNLLESTRGTVEDCIRQKMDATNDGDGIDNDKQRAFGKMLNDFSDTCTQTVEHFKGDISVIKTGQENMRSIVNDVATSIISQKETTLALKKKKKQQKFNEVMIETDIEDVVNDDDVTEDSDDSDWNPESPTKNKRRENKGKKCDATDGPLIGEKINLLHSNLDSLTVKELKEVLRNRNLPLQGKKSDLISRLKENRRDGESQNVASNTSSASSEDDSSSLSKHSVVDLSRDSAQELFSRKIKKNCFNFKKDNVKRPHDSSSAAAQDSSTKVNTSFKKIRLTRKSNDSLMKKKEVSSTLPVLQHSPILNKEKKKTSNPISHRKRARIARRTSLSRTSSRVRNPLSIITNSAKKNRRRSMAKSVSSAFTQLKALESSLNV